jgi:hypothetical protein
MGSPSTAGTFQHANIANFVPAPAWDAVTTSSSPFQSLSPGDEDIAAQVYGTHNTRHAPETLFECGGFAW